MIRGVASRLRGARAALGSGPPGDVALSQPYEGGLSPDLADAEEVRAFLADTDVFGAAAAEAHGYLADAFDRFRITMALLDGVPVDADVLELGANPYFLTRLLARRGLAVTCANWFGARSGFGQRGEQVVTAPSDGRSEAFAFDHFNVETDRFPYPDDRFDVALFCEILEHLPNDPIHTFCELHRVLKPGGTLVLTTPNAARRENLVRMLGGDNVYEQLSGYGTYGRHNREYTVAELTDLLDACGWDVERVFAADLHERTDLTIPAATLAHLDLSDRGDNLFAVARARPGRPSWRYPSWLFSSVHALRRVVQPDLVVGQSCDLQASGLHPLEEIGAVPTRWMGADEVATALVAVPAGAGDGRVAVVVEGIAAPPAAGAALQLTARIAASSATWVIPCDSAPFEVRSVLDVDIEEAVEVEVELSTDRRWTPAEVGLGPDPRRLSLGLRRVALEDTPKGSLRVP